MLSLALPLILLGNPVTIRRVPTPSERLVYKVSGNVLYGGMDSGTKVRLFGEMVMDIVKIDEAGYLQRIENNLSVDTGKEKVSFLKSFSNERYAFDGTPLPFEGEEEEDAATRRASNLSIVPYPAQPVEVGGSWSYVGKADRKRKTPAFRIDMKLLGSERMKGRDAWKVAAYAGETEGESRMQMVSTLWLDKKGGAMVKGTVDLTNLTIDADTGSIGMRMTIERLR